MISFDFGADYTDGPNLRLSTLELFQNPTAVPCRSYCSARSIFTVAISPTRSGRRLAT
jgi:hypothetical protein